MLHFFGYSEKDGELSLSGKRISNVGAPQVNGDAVPKGSLLDLIYPVNSIYLAYSHTSPAELFGGTWTRLENRFLWGCDGKGVIGNVGGESTHTLTIGEMPTHTHLPGSSGSFLATRGNATSEINGVVIGSAFDQSGVNGGVRRVAATSGTGSGTAHNNMPPYIQVSIWRRTA